MTNPDKPVLLDTKPANTADGKVDFGSKNYTLADLGIHLYEIAEVVPNDAKNSNGETYAAVKAAGRDTAGEWTLGGYTYDGHKAIVKVEIKDEIRDGKLEITKTVLPATGSLTFTNKYAAGDSVSFSASKEIDKRAFLDTDNFEFTLTNVTDPAHPVLIKTQPVDKSTGIADLGSITYGLSDAGKTYTYEIAEVIPKDAEPKTVDGKQVWVKDGITYDGHVVTVTVSVTENADGTITATETYSPLGNASFTNKYAAETDIKFFAQKDLSGRDLKAGEFSFKLNGPKVADGGVTVANDVTGRAAFDAISFDIDDLTGPVVNGHKTGEFTYTITEVVPAEADKLPGVTYSSMTAQIKAKLTDNGDGTIKVEYTRIDSNSTAFTLATIDGVGAAGETFENTYAAKGDATVEVAKHLVGRELKNGEFSFTISAVPTPTGTAPMNDADGKAIADTALTVKNAADGTVTFPTFNYTLDDANKVYVYQVAEDSFNIPGVTRDTETGPEYIYAQVTVGADNGNGTLKASTVKYCSDAACTKALTSAEFINKYDTKGEITFSGTKTLENRTLKAGEFTFELYGADGKLIESVKNAADGSYSFSKIAYTGADLDKDANGNYVKTTKTYKVVEKVPAKDSSEYDESITYATNKYDITVTLKDNGNNTMTVTADPKENTYNFTNTYNADGTITFSGTKELTNRTLKADEFTFELYKVEGEGETKTETLIDSTTNAANGNYSFKTLTYGLDDLDTDAAGNYVKTTKTYKVVEKKGNDTSIKYDTKTYDITVTLENDGTGTIKATASPAENMYNFKNEYQTKGEVELTVTKSFGENGVWPKDRTFTFTMEATNDAAKAKTAAPVTVTVSKDDSTKSFGTISFSEADFASATAGADGKRTVKYTYKLTEIVPDDKGGVTYANPQDVTFTATDDGKGTITVDKAVNGVINTTFENKYAAKGEANLYAKKAFEADGAPRNFKAGDFTFTLYNAKGEAVQENVANGNKGSVDQATFEPIKYTIEDVGTYEYTIKEDIPAGATDNGDGTFTKDGITYAENPTKITVTVADNGNGTLKVTYAGGTVEGAPNGAAFTNTYAATATAQLSATKTLNDKTPKANAFEFSLTGPKIEGGSTTAKNDADGNVTFSTIIYNLEDLKKTNSDGKKCDEFNYTISEVVPDDATNAAGKTFAEVEAEGGDTAAKFTLAGITYQKQTKNVKITVTDNGDGTLDVKYDGKPEFAGVAFTNTYAAKGSVQFGATKTLTGRELEAGEFEFELRNESGAKVGENKITNAADGTVTFDAIEYTLADLDNGTKKTLNYTVKEVIPEPADQLRGVTYSNAEHKVTVVLTDNGNGTISSVVTVDGDEVKPDENGIVQVGDFANTYFEATATGEFIKNYYGGAEEKTFNFQLRAANADGSDRSADPIERKADEDGKLKDAGDSDSFYFDFTGTVKSTSTPIELPAKFSYAKPGTYYYIIKELPSGTDVTCDPAQILMKVEVKGTTAKDATTEVSYRVIQGGQILTKVYKGEDHPVLYNNGNMLLGMRRTALANVNGVAQVTYFMPEVRKVMENGVLSGGEFKFELRNAEGTVIDDATNDADGNVSFKAIEYTDAGDFTYTITEVNGGAAAIKYSSIEAKLTVKVTKDADGKLTAKASYSYTDDAGKAVTCDPAKGEYPTFVNQYDTIIVKAFKGTREFDANGKAYAGEGLPGAHYGLWMVNPNGNDVYLGLGRNQADATGAKLESNADGYLWYDLPMVEGVAYYLLEEEPAPAGHLIDPYRTDYFTLIKAGEGEKVAFHLAYEGSAEFTEACPGVNPHR